jgi:drug/metabolite transporter (DMT)-like permease
MFIGLLSLTCACLCWSLVFIIPLLLPEFSPIEIALGRFFCYGLLSFGFLAVKNRSLFQKKYLYLWKKGTVFGFFSTLLCFTSMVFCVRLASSSVTALIYALSPITIALLGNRKEKVYNQKDLMLPLAIMLIGILFTNLGAFKTANTSLFTFMTGIIFGFIGLFSWTWFACENSQFMQKEKNITLTDWSLLMGTAMLILTVIIALLIYPFISFRWTMQFFIGSFLLGVIGTWLAFFFWNFGSKKVPVSLAGQMMILEVIFGLSLVFSYFKKWPSSFEIIGATLMIFGVVLSTFLMKKEKNLPFKD